MRRTIAAVLMALLLAIAIQFIWGVAVAWGVGLRDTLLPPVAGDYHWIQENIELLHDGTPAVQTYTDVGGWTFRTIDRRPVAKADFDVPSPPKLAGPLHPGTRGSKDLRRWLLRMRSFLVRQEGIAETWYAVSDPDGSTRFVAFDAFSRGIIGYLGRDGFSTSPPLPGKRFSVPRSFLTTWTPEGSLSDHELSVPYNPLCDASPILLPLKDEVVVIDLRKRTIVPIWKGAPIDAEWYAFPGYDTDEDRNQFSRNKFDVAVIRTPTRLHAVFLDRKEACDVDIPELLRDKSFSVYRVSSRGLTLIAEMPSPSPSYVAWLTVEGPLRILEVPLDNTNSITCDRWPMIGFKIPQPAGLVIAWFYVQQILAGSDDLSVVSAPSIRAAGGDDWSRFLPTLALAAVVGAGLAAMAWRRQRLYGLEQGAVWATFVFLLGVPGWLAYRWHRAWPTLAQCPRCGAMAPRNRETCIRCGAAFPPPKPEPFDIRDRDAREPASARSDRS